MSSFDHENILKLIGIVSIGEYIYSYLIVNIFGSVQSARSFLTPAPKDYTEMLIVVTNTYYNNNTMLTILSYQYYANSAMLAVLC